jgi:hypothetical protein
MHTDGTGATAPAPLARIRLSMFTVNGHAGLGPSVCIGGSIPLLCRMPPEARVVFAPAVAGGMTDAVVDILDQSMCPEANESETELPPPVARNQQPGMFASIGSIVAGVIGFSLPVVGMAASCIGIWFGVQGIRQGRAAKYRPSIICGMIGISVDGLGIVFWVCAVLFESYH